MAIKIGNWGYNPYKVALCAPTYYWYGTHLVEALNGDHSLTDIIGYTWLKIFEASNLTNWQYIDFAWKRNNSYPCESLIEASTLWTICYQCRAHVFRCPEFCEKVHISRCLDPNKNFLRSHFSTVRSVSEPICVRALMAQARLGHLGVNEFTGQNKNARVLQTISNLTSFSWLTICKTLKPYTQRRGLFGYFEGLTVRFVAIVS